jgi:hypothetical protein
MGAMFGIHSIPIEVDILVETTISMHYILDILSIHLASILLPRIHVESVSFFNKGHFNTLKISRLSDMSHKSSHSTVCIVRMHTAT